MPEGVEGARPDVGDQRHPNRAETTQVSIWMYILPPFVTMALKLAQPSLQKLVELVALPMKVFLLITLRRI